MIWTDQEDLKDPPFLERLPVPTNGIFPNGTVIHHLFKKDGDRHRTWLKGLITTYDAERKLYMVLYTDGDSEEMEYAEIVKNRKQLYKHLDSLHILIQMNLAPTADNMDSSVPTIDIYSLRAITKLQHLDISFEEEDFSTEEIEIFINVIQSKATTPEEQALGHFTRRKLKTLDTWKKWEFSECKELNQYQKM